MSLIDTITFPLAARGPFLPVRTSGMKPGTYDEAVAAGGLDRSGFTAPYVSTGVNLGEVFAGAAMQEVWEMGLQQIYQLLTLAFCVILFPALILLTHGLFGAGSVPVMVGLSVIATAVLLAVVGQRQTAGSEEQSHAISVVAAIKYDGVTEERARQQFVDNLSAYGYSALAGKSEPQLAADVTARRPYAEAWLARPVNQARAVAFRKEVTDQPRDVQIAQQVAVQ